MPFDDTKWNTPAIQGDVGSLALVVSRALDAISDALKNIKNKEDIDQQIMEIESYSQYLETLVKVLTAIVTMPVDKTKEAMWLAMQEHNGNRHNQAGGGQAGGSGGTPPDNLGMKDYVDAKIETVEHKLMGRLDQLATKATIWGAVATLTAILLAVLAFGGGRLTPVSLLLIKSWNN